MSQTPKPPREILEFYALGGEAGRLDEAYFPLERARTRELVARHLPAPPGVVLDVGGAAGAYAFWLAEQGYEVHLSDPVPLHVQQAAERSAALQSGKLASVRVGDARALDRADASADAVVLLGPLYHLPERADRRAALGEAHRVLRRGGWLFAAAISRFASLLDGLRGALFEEPAFAALVERDLATGRHINDTGRPLFFTTAFFHEPEELALEVRDAGFEGAGPGLPDVFAVEGPGAFLPDFAARWQDSAHRETLLGFLRRVEQEPSLLGASPHLLAVARRP
jgi:ubiquinone/menaquinone biosynthesis C-methylase UbiE